MLEYFSFCIIKRKHFHRSFSFTLTTENNLSPLFSYEIKYGIQTVHSFMYTSYVTIQ